MSSLRILVIGRNGQVARSLQYRAELQGIPILCVGREQYDLSRAARMPVEVEGFRPTIVVNAAAYTAVDKAENDQEAAYALNSVGPTVLAGLLRENNLPFIHISTDYVFDGSKADGPYRESDPTSPLGVYGKSKLAGEEGVLKEYPQTVILRTSWVYSPFGNNFVKTMLRLSETRSEISVVDDQYGCPTSALDLAEAIIKIASEVLENPTGDYGGVYHLCGGGEATWRALAEETFKAAGIECKVHPITTAEFATPAKRPLNSRLIGVRAAEVFRLELKPWKHALNLVLKHLTNKN
ncbi:dTDP-4-dehydrorhamnose reductase [Flexibacterium corallicola]|uniref:dTDP-4-dehydrorhamnose reductase n=1 Tax=Flexibacterium corallicola TaxID=3037259 RepID=UPI00286F3B46|nr:dTDP-4-dehydrorhamnose reductase [Pseudovibrio sp. M1P-2-3]